MRALAIVALTALGGCSSAPAAPKATEPSAASPAAHPEEIHLADLRQLTFGGENAEAYWSFDGSQLVFQASPPGQGCDQIYRMPATGAPTPTRVSSGEGATTCAFFLPGDQHIIYASTHLGGAACPPKPDRSQGYVWPLYPSYDIFKVEVGGSDPVPLTQSPGYDAEATVCPKDGSIVFTSVRDGDLELYRMDADGKNVKRLTHAPGYDGGAFFSQDCSKLVWRASRPTGEALEDYQKLLADNLVRPTKLELWVANADGSDARQVTYLDAASFAPYFFPSGERIIFSSNVGDPKGREFDLWAIDVDGTDLERITFTPGFDGFPMFSPDGSRLVFASNRATAEGAHDTNVFVARWVDAPPKAATASGADRVQTDIAWLADPARGGRGIGTEGLVAAGAYIEQRFRALGLETRRQPFEVPTRVTVDPSGTRLILDGRAVAAEDYQPLASSKEGEAEGAVVFAGYGIVSEELGLDDYASMNVKDKIVVVRRFVPDSVGDPALQRRLSDLRYKAWVARERGATALLVVDAPEPNPPGAGAPEEAPFPALHPASYGDAGIPVVLVKRRVGSALLGKGRHRAELGVELRVEKSEAFNVLAKLPANASSRLPGSVILGAHYDHLGMGGPGSLAPDTHAPHLGADDNASGVAALFEAALQLKEVERRRDVWLLAFSGEESGILGSTHFVKSAGDELDAIAMINMDMVGRLRENTLSALGSDSAAEWSELVADACEIARVTCQAGGDGYGPSDQTPFYAAGVPVLHLFTGAHADYHKPSDSADRINAAGVAQIARATAELAASLSRRAGKLSYRKVASPPPAGDLRSYGASLGSVPDYAGPPQGQKGVLLADVRPGGAAQQAGMQRGDILIQLSKHQIGDVRDLMYALAALKPGERVTAVVLRAGKRLELPVTLQQSRRSHGRKP